MSNLTNFFGFSNFSTTDFVPVIILTVVAYLIIKVVLSSISSVIRLAITVVVAFVLISSYPKVVSQFTDSINQLGGFKYNTLINKYSSSSTIN